MDTGKVDGMWVTVSDGIQRVRNESSSFDGRGGRVGGEDGNGR